MKPSLDDYFKPRPQVEDWLKGALSVDGMPEIKNANEFHVYLETVRSDSLWPLQFREIKKLAVAFGLRVITPWIPSDAEYQAAAFGPKDQDFLDRWNVAVDSLCIEVIEHLRTNFTPRILSPDTELRDSRAANETFDEAELDEEIPPLDTKSGDWVKSREENEKILGLKIATLKSYRQTAQGGKVSCCKMFGVDKDGRKWRREGTEKSMVYYLRNSLPKSGD